MRRLTAILGYTGAALTVAAMLVTPFLLFNLFGRLLVRTGIRVDPVYQGGDSVRVVPRDGYRIVVYRPYLPVAPLSSVGPYAQVAWAPAHALPAHVEDEVDLDGDGRADLCAAFDVPRDPEARLAADVRSLGNKVQPPPRIGRQNYGLLIARANDRIVLRVPLSKEEARRARAAR